MLTRREFIHGSCGVALGAVLAGLSFAPTNAHAIAGVDDAALGYVVCSILAAYGVGLVSEAVLENGGAAAIGNAFRYWCTDAQNYNSILASANSQVSHVSDCTLDSSALTAAIADASYLDGLASAMDVSGTGWDLDLDWLNFRDVAQAALFGAIGAFSSMLLPETSALVLDTVGKADLRMLDGNADFTALYSHYGITSGSTDYKKLSDSLAKLGAISFTPVCSTVYSYWSERDHVWSINAIYYKNFPTFALTYGTGVNSGKISGLDASGVGTYSNIGVRYSPSSDKVVQSSCSTFDIDTVRAFGISQGEYVLTDVIGSYPFKLSEILTAGIGLPSANPVSDTPTAIDGDFGFGGALVGTGYGIGDDVLGSAGQMHVGPDVYNPSFDASLDTPWGGLVWDAGAGVFNPSDVWAIPGVGAPAIPLDTPLDVSIPDVLNPDIAVPDTTTLEQIISDALTTSISKAIDTPIEAVGEPFYPVNPPGTDSKPPEDLPLGDFPFQNVFPFNMLFDWLKWIRDNI